MLIDAISLELGSLFSPAESDERAGRVNPLCRGLGINSSAILWACCLILSPVLVAAFPDPSGPVASVRVRRDEERPCEQNTIDPNASGDDPVHGYHAFLY